MNSLKTLQVTIRGFNETTVSVKRMLQPLMSITIPTSFIVILPWIEGDDHITSTMKKRNAPFSIQRQHRYVQSRQGTWDEDITPQPIPVPTGPVHVPPGAWALPNPRWFTWTSREWMGAVAEGIGMLYHYSREKSRELIGRLWRHELWVPLIISILAAAVAAALALY